MTMTPRNVTPTKAKAKVPAIKYDVREEDLPEAIEDGTRTLIKMLFAEGEGIRICEAHFNEEKKEVPKDGGVCLSREEWLRRLDAKDGNINKIFASSDKCGIYVGINPYKIGCTKDADVIAFRHALFEFDDGLSCGEQLNLYRQMKLPAAALIYSGGKSVHAWVKIDAQNRQEYDERVALLFEHFESAGFKPDIKNKNPGRLSRLPGCVRFKSRQELLAVNLDVSYAGWIGAHQADGVRSWIDIKPDAEATADAILVGPGNWLTRGSGLLLVGATGCGKSTLDATLGFSFAIGREALGLRPTRPLKSLIIQAEDDDLDLEAMASGIISDISPTAEESELIRANVRLITERSKTGSEFLSLVARLLESHKPDLLHINPLSSFFGNDLNDQQKVAEFFRNGMNPLLAEHRCALLCVHHTAKPSKDRDSWRDGAQAYAGSGSADLANWAREVLTLRQVATGLYELAATKRWRKLGWTDADGKAIGTRLIAHARDGSQVWRDATGETLEALGATPYSAKGLCDLVPEAGIDKAELLRLVVETFAISQRTASSYLSDGARARRHNVAGVSGRFALLAEAKRPRREVYPEQPANRPVIWVTLTEEGNRLCNR